MPPRYTRPPPPMPPRLLSHEERLARPYVRPLNSVKERMDRAKTHRLYLIDRQSLGSTPSRHEQCWFQILGATGNVYRVDISTEPQCSCPDSGNGYVCKHRMFVMLKILHCSDKDSRVWQRVLRSSEVRDLLSRLAACDAALGRNSLLLSSDACVLASRTVREAVRRIPDPISRVNHSLLRADQDQQEGAAGQEIPKSVQRALDSDCPICFTALGDSQGNPTEPSVFCRTCGNSVHSECFDKWQKAKAQQKLTCVLCRAPWHIANGKRKRVGQRVGEQGVSLSGLGYVNVAALSEHHRHLLNEIIDV